MANSHRVFVTGASGFVGSHVIDELLRHDFRVTASVHRRPLKVGGDRVHLEEASLFDVPALASAMRDCSAVVHIVGIIAEKESQGITFERMHLRATQCVVDAAKIAGVKRYVHMSALGTRPDAVSDYHKTKYRAEEYVRTSGLDWTIFRPSLIHGHDGEFMQMEAKWVRMKAPPFLFMPYFGAGFMGWGGAGILQPVFVDDVARAFVESLHNPKSIGEIYLLAGSQKITWPELHRISAEAIRGEKRWVMAIPAWKAKLLTHVVPASLLPFNRDQVIMSQEDNTADIRKFVDHFNWTPVGFAESLAMYAKKM